MELLDLIEQTVKTDKQGVPDRTITIIGCGKL
jgi:hypothetical protein